MKTTTKRTGDLTIVTIDESTKRKRRTNLSGCAEVVSNAVMWLAIVALAVLAAWAWGQVGTGF